MAGFTNITFKPTNVGLIDGAESYVSFSRYSDAVSLPQDPGRGNTTRPLAIQWVSPSVCPQKAGCPRISLGSQEGWSAWFLLAEVEMSLDPLPRNQLSFFF